MGGGMEDIRRTRSALLRPPKLDHTRMSGALEHLPECKLVFIQFKVHICVELWQNNGTLVFKFLLSWP